MIVLDTNVISELLRLRPEPSVLNWIESQPIAALFTTAITRAELLFGLHCLPVGKRGSALQERMWAILNGPLAAHTLPFDLAAADAYAEIAAQRRAAGRPGGQADTMIAAIARTQDAKVATRNIRDFDGCGVEVINPWG